MLRNLCCVPHICRRRKLLNDLMYFVLLLLNVILAFLIPNGCHHFQVAPLPDISYSTNRPWSGLFDPSSDKTDTQTLPSPPYRVSNRNTCRRQGNATRAFEIPSQLDLVTSPLLWICISPPTAMAQRSYRM